MIDLNRPEKKPENEPNDVEIVALIITIIVWVFLITGVMMG